jgi:hypothetical protein
MRIQINETSVSLWISARETEDWATRPSASWPCSQLRGRRLFAGFDRNGLCDLAIDGKSDVDIDGNELTAICADFLRANLSENHPCFDVAVGQFN